MLGWMRLFPLSHTSTGVVALSSAYGSKPSIAAHDRIERSADWLQSMPIEPQAEQHDSSSPPRTQTAEDLHPGTIKPTNVSTAAAEADTEANCKAGQPWGQPPIEVDISFRSPAPVLSWRVNPSCR